MDYVRCKIKSPYTFLKHLCRLHEARYMANVNCIHASSNLRLIPHGSFKAEITPQTFLLTSFFYFPPPREMTTPSFKLQNEIKYETGRVELRREGEV
jgi:hypothetical protein